MPVAFPAADGRPAAPIDRADRLPPVKGRIRNAPPALLGATVVVALQGLLVAVLGALVGVQALRGAADNLPAAEFMAVLGVAAGMGLLLAARGLLMGRRWGRAPALLTQLLCVPVAVALVQAQQYLIGITLGLVAAAAAFCLISRPVAEALDDPRSR